MIMNVHGIGPTLSTSSIPRQGKTTQESQVTQDTSSTLNEATTVEISEEAKNQSRQTGKAKPHEIAEALGAKNFGQALKALREAGVDLNSGFVSNLVHGDEEALAKAQETLAPPPEEVFEPVVNPEVPPSEQPVVDLVEGTPQPLDTGALLQTLLAETQTEIIPA
jgi:hypothetical protein